MVWVFFLRKGVYIAGRRSTALPIPCGVGRPSGHAPPKNRGFLGLLVPGSILYMFLATPLTRPVHFKIF
jgi:hypothetical protein